MDNQLKLTALPPEKVVEILTRSGFRDMTMQKLERDISAGLPLNGDGTVNFFEYMQTDAKGKESVFSWVTNIHITKNNIFALMKEVARDGRLKTRHSTH